MNYELRNYSEIDYQEVMELWKQAGIKISLSDEKEELDKLAFKKDNQFIILQVDDQIIGTIICAHDGRRGYIHHLAILPKFQKQGYGKLLLNEAIKHYNALDTVKVHIFIEKTNIGVVEFYQNLGWETRTDIELMTLTLREE